MSREGGAVLRNGASSYASSLYAFIGLGNPGAGYADTRHNVGFRVIDAWLHRLRVRLAPVGRHFHAVVVTIEQREVLLLKPMTYMNRSGRAVVEACERYGLLPERLVVICDDVNLPFGKLRLRAQGSDGGNRGLASIIEALGTQAFPRQRIGVGAPESRIDLVDYVLDRFTEEEEETLGDMIDRACMQLQTLLVEGLATAASRYNG